MLCIGHRGAMGHEPENTLRSVAKALELGVDWIEIDVYAVEGELVVIHDDELDRTTNGTGLVTEQSLAYLRSLDAGKGEKIPLLREVFDLVDRRVGINVELKGPETAVSTLNFLQPYLAAGWDLRQLLLSSFRHDELAIARQHHAEVPLGVLLWGNIDVAIPTAQQLRALSVNPWYKELTEPFVQEAHAHGFLVLPYTVNEPDDITRLRGWGVDGMFTNYPERVRDAHKQ